MLNSIAPGRLSTAENSRVCSAINRKALENAMLLLAQNEARLAHDASLDADEREHHAVIARLAAR